MAGALAGLVAGAGLSVVPMSGASAAANPAMSVAPMPVAAVSLAQAGEVAMWGPGLPGYVDQGQATVPASLADVAVTQVAMADRASLGLTAAGQVVSWGANQARLERVPDAVKAAKVAQVTASYESYAGVVTRDGRVLTWGRKTSAASPLDVPPGLSGVKQLALTLQNAIALKNDGSVVAWGSEANLNAPPSDLRAAAIVTSPSTAYALTTSGTVRAWGENLSGQLNLPAEVTLAGNVKAVAALSGGAIALLADNTLVSWGSALSPAFQTWMSSLDPVSITASNGNLVVVDRDGVVHHRATWAAQAFTLPTGLSGRALANIAAGSDPLGAVVITKMLRGEDPTITGTPTVGSTLTAAPGTFSASPTSVTSQWLADDKVIASATGATLPLTADLVGKKITYRSTATKAGEATIFSTSAALTVTNPPPPPSIAVDSKTKVLKVQVAKKAAKLTVTGKVTASKPVTGKAKVTIKKGKKAIVAKTVNVSAKGAVSLTVKKFGKLAIKKTKPKGKKGKGKKGSYRGSYTVTIAYAGNADVKASNGSKKFKVK